MPAAKSGADATAAARDARRLSTLLEMSQALSGTLNLKSAIQRVLATLIRHHSVVRGMVTLLRDGELLVEAAEGFEDRARTVRFKVGEGHHREGGRERQADCRAARQPRAGVPQSGAAPPRSSEAGTELRLRADFDERVRPSARSPSTSGSRPSATTTAA